MKASARPFQLLGLFIALAGCSRAPDTFERVAEAQSEVDDPACKDIHPHVRSSYYDTKAKALKDALKDCKQQCCLDLCMCDETSLECKKDPLSGWYCQGKDTVNVPGGVQHRATCRDLKRSTPGGGGGAGGAAAAGGAGGIVITPGSDSSLETCEAAGGAGGSPSTGGSGGSPGTTTGSGGSPATGGGM